MATLVLTAMGTALGGPIGGAIGAVLGQGFDQNVLFKPKGREGPRLSELDVQTSTYGSQVPQIFGAMRVAGTVIWATDLNENKQKSGGGKGRPSVTSYRSEEHTSELQSLMRISYAVFCLKKKKHKS